MFWGLIMEPGRRYTQEVKKSFHISMASLDLDTADDKPAQILCGHEGRNYLLCTLKAPDQLQCALDLEFAPGGVVSFAANGKGHIHLTGYLTDIDEDSLNLEDLNGESDESEEEEVSKKINQKKQKSSHSITKTEPPTKKAKLLNGSEENGEEEESDDPDFEEHEAEETDEDSDEVEGEGEDSNDDDEEEEEDTVEEEQKPSPPKKEISKKKHQEAAAEQKPKVKKQSLKGNVTVEDLVEGTGPEAKVGKFVTVYYEGRLQQSNKIFDSTNKGPGFKFRLGAGEVIKGWDIGLVGMKVGGKRRIVCPPKVAYGIKGSPPAIPANATLIFTVTLLKTK